MSSGYSRFSLREELVFRGAKNDDRGRSEISRRAFLQAASALALAGGCQSKQAMSGALDSVIVLGVDGMDPVLTRQFMAAGRLPNCRRLIEAGSLHDLATSNPPQSPVAWSNFISGTNPGGHGIFDFIARDPQTMQPYHSTSRVEPGGRTLRVGSLAIPLAPGKVHNLRRGPTLWDELERHGVPCTVFRVPANFPPSEGEATTVAGMGTPDLQGGYGTFTWFTDAPQARSRDLAGGRIERIEWQDNTVVCKLAGPLNEFSPRQERVEAMLTVTRDPERAAARIEVDGRVIVLNEREWSDWIVVSFPLVSHAVSVSGICRVYLKSVREPFGLYVSPINIDPADPALPLTTPPDYSRRLVRELGYYYTQGMVEDTHALSAGVLDAGEYRQQALFVHDERLRFFEHELARFQRGFLFFYFSTLDLSSHMFWRAIDPQHPLYSPELAKSDGDFIAALYQKVDDAIGRVLDRLDGRTWLMVMSDHGFNSFRRQFNLNSWLLDNGYLRTKRAPVRDGSVSFQDIDWGRTRAYGLGLNGLYLNRAGREAQGPVSAREAEGLARELAQRLERVEDHETGERVISRIFRASEVYTGPFAAEGPDLIVGYNRNYRASWDTILGGVPRKHILDNGDAWSGDHCIDPQHVPGVLLSSRAIPAGPAGLEDLAPTILSAFGAPVPAEMTGRRLL